MRLYVWENDRISDAYHDDGTLVVLAESPEQAREVVRATAKPYRDWREHDVRTDVDFWADDAPAGLRWDGTDEALNRPPDRVIDLTTPMVVAFNGGGYD